MDAKAVNEKALPNPGSSQFTLKLESNLAKERMSLRVTDVLGKWIEVRINLYAGQTIQIGNNYRQGIYFIEVTQGINKKQLKLMKL